MEMMDTSNFVSKVPLFDGQNYVVWEVMIKANLCAYDLWEAMENDEDIEHLPNHVIEAQLNLYNEATTRKYAVLTTIFSTLSENLFT